MLGPQRRDRFGSDAQSDVCDLYKYTLRLSQMEADGGGNEGVDVKCPVRKERRHLPESGLSIARDAASRAFNSTLLSERSRRTALLATLLLHLLSRRGSHALVGGARLLHTVAVVFLRKLALLLGGVVLECHYECRSV